MNSADCRRIDIDDPLFDGAVALRDRVLRDPLGRHSARHEHARDRGGSHFIALDGAAVIGCLALYPGTGGPGAGGPDAGGAAILRGMAVAPEAEGAGVGKALYAYAEAWARRRGVVAIEAEARSDAVGFYQACGFVAEGDEYLGHGIAHRKVRKGLARA